MMRTIGMLLLILILAGIMAACAPPDTEPDDTVVSRLSEVEAQLEQISTRLPPETADLRAGLGKPDGTCQYAASCAPHPCCTWRGGSCWCDTCCLAVKPELEEAATSAQAGEPSE